MVGKDLIKSAEVRSIINQIEQYKVATNTFKVKYGYLPGDIPASAASALGLAARGTLRGEGDGNDVIEGSVCWMGGNFGRVTWSARYVGEPFVFWRDLSDTKLIKQTFNAASATCPTPNPTGAAVFLYQPQLDVGDDSYGVVVWSGGYGSKASPTSGIVSDRKNYLSAASYLYNVYSIDVKLDDGLPQSGSVFNMWPGTWGGVGGYNVVTGIPDQSAAPENPNYCYDNGGVPGPTHYSLANSWTLQCALAIRLQ